MSQTSESRTATLNAEHEAEKPDFVSRLSLIFALAALFLAIGYVLAVVLVHLGVVAAGPAWSFLAQHVIPQVAVILGAAAVGLHLLDTWHLLARQRVFDPRETQRDLAIDDLAALVSRLQLGCALRVAIPLGLFGALLALVASLFWTVPYTDAFQVINNNSPHVCSATDNVAPFSLELDNSASTVSVSWSARPVEHLANGKEWAQIRPSEGKLAAGQQQRVYVFADAFVCVYGTANATLHQAGDAIVSALLPKISTYHVSITTSGRTTRTSIAALSVAGAGEPTPTASVVATPTPTARSTATAQRGGAPTATASRSATPTATATATATATTMATITPTATAPTCPTLTDSISMPTDGQYFYSDTGDPVSIKFSGSYSGGCGDISTDDITWSYTISGSTQIMGVGTGITYPVPCNNVDSYTILLQVFDPATGHTANKSISIWVWNESPT